MECELHDLPVSSGGRGRGRHDEAVLLGSHFHQGQRNRRVGNAEHQVDVLVVVPALGDADTDIDLALEIGRHQLDRFAEHRAAEIGNGKLDRGDIAGPRGSRRRTGHVVQHADLHGIVLRQRRAAEQATGQQRRHGGSLGIASCPPRRIFIAPILAHPLPSPMTMPAGNGAPQR